MIGKLYLEWRINHVKLVVEVLNICQRFNEGGQHFVVLVSDLEFKIRINRVPSKLSHLEHLPNDSETIRGAESLLHSEADLLVDDVHLHWELLAVDRVLGPTQNLKKRLYRQKSSKIAKNILTAKS